MSETITNEDLINLQRQITKALQKQVLSTIIGGNFRLYMEALGYSVRLQDKLSCNEHTHDMQSMSMREY